MEENLLREDPILSAKHPWHKEPRSESETASDISQHEDDAQNNENSSISWHETVPILYKEYEENMRLFKQLA